jgi:uncharacterized Zn finger protein
MRKQSTARSVTLDQATISRFVAAKGERLHRAEVVDFLDHLSVGQRRVYVVTGDHGTYRVTLMTYAEPWTGTCGCPTRGMCSHLRAAQLREAEARIVQAQPPAPATCRDCHAELEPAEQAAGICGSCLFARL